MAKGHVRDAQINGKSDHKISKKIETVPVLFIEFSDLFELIFIKKKVPSQPETCPIKGKTLF